MLCREVNCILDKNEYLMFFFIFFRNWKVNGFRLNDSIKYV